MATVNFDRDEINGRAHSAIWLGLSQTDNDGLRYTLPGGSDRSVQVLGTFGGGTLSLQGSNMPSPSTSDADWFALNDPGGVPLAFAGVGGAAVLENTRWLRPRLVGATGGGVDVYLISKAV